MRDISAKIVTQRIATARSILYATPETIAKIHAGEIPKGNPLEIAKVAAVQAAKNTHQIIPYCHQIPIDYVGVEYEFTSNSIIIHVTVKCNAKTGVEMEALTGASVCALTLYDMMKMLDEAMTIGETVLVSKKGGKSDFRQAFTAKLSALVIVVSDSVSQGKKEDISGKLIVERLRQLGLSSVDYAIVSDDPKEIESVMLNASDKQQVNLILTTGGTGISPRDNTPEVTAKLIERELPGITEAARSYGQDRTPYSMLSRGMAGVRGQTLIINLPGSQGGVKDSMDALFPAVLHSFKMLWGYGHDAAEANDKNAGMQGATAAAENTALLESAAP